MSPIFKPEVILHIEDDGIWHEEVQELLTGPTIQDAYGRLVVISSVLGERATYECNQELIDKEIERIELQRGNQSALISIVNAQVARGYLNRVLPGVVISDNSFPLNGKKVAEWIQAHGYPDYAMIGLSSTHFDALDPLLQRWFGKGNSRFFAKSEVYNQQGDFVQQIIRNQRDNMRRYGKS